MPGCGLQRAAKRSNSCQTNVLCHLVVAKFYRVIRHATLHVSADNVSKFGEGEIRVNRNLFYIFDDHKGRNENVKRKLEIRIKANKCRFITTK